MKQQCLNQSAYHCSSSSLTTFLLCSYYDWITSAILCQDPVTRPDLTQLFSALPVQCISFVHNEINFTEWLMAPKSLLEWEKTGLQNFWPATFFHLSTPKLFHLSRLKCTLMKHVLDPGYFLWYECRMFNTLFVYNVTVCKVLNCLQEHDLLHTTVHAGENVLILLSKYFCV